MAELKPCPFCGGEARIVKNSFPPGNIWRHPTCETEGCPGEVHEQDEQGGTNCDLATDKEAAALWNRRALGAAEAGERERHHKECACLNGGLCNCDANYAYAKLNNPAAPNERAAPQDGTGAYTSPDLESAGSLLAVKRAQVAGATGSDAVQVPAAAAHPAEGLAEELEALISHARLDQQPEEAYRMNVATIQRAAAALRSSAGQVPQGFTPEQADCILKCREALLANDETEAWHWLYQLQTKQPNYDPFSPWINLEIAQDKLAAAERGAK